MHNVCPSLMKAGVDPGNISAPKIQIGTGDRRMETYENLLQVWVTQNSFPEKSMILLRLLEMKLSFKESYIYHKPCVYCDTLSDKFQWCLDCFHMAEMIGGFATSIWFLERWSHFSMVFSKITFVLCNQRENQLLHSDLMWENVTDMRDFRRDMITVW